MHLLFLPYAAQAQSGARIDCATAVLPPVDSAPMRSPQAVHTAMLPHLRGKQMVEIGTRRGDGMACFSRVAASALAVEIDRRACDFLKTRAAAQQQAVGASWQVICQDYRTAAGLDGDVFTWWQEYPHLRNMAVLRSLRKLQLTGSVRRGAEAILVFDHSEPTDLASLSILRSLGWIQWLETVHVHEKKLCEAKRLSPKLCRRADGTFHLGSVRVSDVNATVAAAQPDPLQIAGERRFQRPDDYSREHLEDR